MLDFGFFVSAVTVLRYLTYSSPNYDFGLFCNMFHYMKETGLPLVTSERNGLLSHFAVHFSPILYLLVPFAFIFDTLTVLVFAQILLVFAGVFPIFLICRQVKLSNAKSAIMSLLYISHMIPTPIPMIRLTYRELIFGMGKCGIMR